MNSRDFCYWLRGYFELAPEEGLTHKQIDLIKEHLDKVFAEENQAKDIWPSTQSHSNILTC